MGSNKKVWIVKASGEREPFSEKKFRSSLKKTGASQQTIDKITKKVKKKLYDGISTSKIYDYAHKLLRKRSRPAAGKYSIKKAIMHMGPSGYPFEKLVAEILKTQGYNVQTGRKIKGFCVTHEVDVVAHKKGKKIVAECKYHNRHGIKSDVVTALYVHSRFEDIKKEWNTRKGEKNIKKEGWLITNTRLTSDAKKYLKCVGLTAIAWNYPKKNSLEDLITEAGLHPLTTLTTLSNSNKKDLLRKNIILCKELIKSPKKLQSIGLRKRRIDTVVDEAKKVCA
jgi:Holliday junction resolvase